MSQVPRRAVKQPLSPKHRPVVQNVIIEAADGATLPFAWTLLSESPIIQAVAGEFADNIEPILVEPIEDQGMLKDFRTFLEITDPAEMKIFLKTIDKLAPYFAELEKMFNVADFLGLEDKKNDIGKYIAQDRLAGKTTEQMAELMGIPKEDIPSKEEQELIKANIPDPQIIEQLQLPLDQMAEWLRPIRIALDTPPTAS